MSATVELLDALRAAHGNCTDYRAGKLLGVTTSAVSKWRLGQTQMSSSMAARAAQLARLDPAEWVLRVEAEREPAGPGVEAMRDAIRRLSGRAAALILTAAAACLAAPESSANAGVSALSSAPDHLTNLYIMRTRRRRRRLGGSSWWARLFGTWLPAWPTEPLAVRP